MYLSILNKLKKKIINMQLKNNTINCTYLLSRTRKLIFQLLCKQNFSCVYITTHKNQGQVCEVSEPIHPSLPLCHHIINIITIMTGTSKRHTMFTYSQTYCRSIQFATESVSVPIPRWHYHVISLITCHYYPTLLFVACESYVRLSAWLCIFIILIDYHLFEFSASQAIAMWQANKIIFGL